ncbi:MAG: iron ABC transporter permease [Deltaproteobacteria bacterium]|nr:iron ABC transporter permease [Deltaproteobacteria bacterium]
MFGGLLAGVVLLAILSLGLGAFEISIREILESLVSPGNETADVVVWNIRLPRIVSAVVSGAALGLSGMAMQSLLKNPLASPFTLGISQGAGFGAAVAIVVIDLGLSAASGPDSRSVAGVAQGYFLTTMTAFFAFLGAMAAATVILGLAVLRQLSTQSVILAGVALASLFTSGTVLIQYFATETEIASIVFWTFGDLGRAGWPEIILITMIFMPVMVFFLANQWSLNTLLAGDKAALGLGVNVVRLRLSGMFLAGLLAAMVTAFHGVIAFLGLLAPHIARRIIGPEHSMLMPFSCLIGSLLLLAADTLGRVLVGSGGLPVGVLTSFLGAPLFLSLLMRRSQWT